MSIMSIILHNKLQFPRRLENTLNDLSIIFYYNSNLFIRLYPDDTNFLHTNTFWFEVKIIFLS